MDYDAFAAGVEPGGLRNTNEIGILICYILDKADRPFPQSDLIEVIQSNGMANYFETTSALSELIRCGNIVYDDEEQTVLSISKEGRLISKLLNNELSLSIRQKAVSATMKLAEKRKIEQENPVVITKADDGGYNVSLRITDGIRDLMKMEVFVPDKKDANLVKRNFHSNPERLYSIMLAAIVGEKEMVNEALKELKNES
ncbi:MAG: DUF4364 family protein [Clostridia bacterium]|nr:DUF4364 family protein [Clostridia bacterium]